MLTREDQQNCDSRPVADVIEEYERKVFDLKQLIEISKGLNSSLEYNVLIDSILLTCMGQMQLIKAGIFLSKGLDSNSFVLHRNYKGFELNHHIEYSVQSSSTLIDVLNAEPKCFTLEDLEAAIPEYSKDLETLKEIDPCLIVPLKGKGKLNGIIVLGERITGMPFSRYEKEYLLNIASLAGIAIQNAYLYELATTDMMTKLKIHHFFQTVLVEERERALHRKLPLSLLMIDIDHFKNFNDTYGHQCGDIVLKRVAQVIKESCRRIDIPARYGGEEMAVIMPNTDLEAAMIAAERLRKDIEGAVVSVEDLRLSVTVSIGVAEFNPERDVDNHSFIERTDKALYMSKDAGRNRVSCLK